MFFQCAKCVIGSSRGVGSCGVFKFWCLSLRMIEGFVLLWILSALLSSNGLDSDSHQHDLEVKAVIKGALDIL